jgi:integrase
VLDAGAQFASQALVARGLPPLPHVTPHTMRRTYVSIMLLATEFDLPFVQHQVGTRTPSSRSTCTTNS